MTFAERLRQLKDQSGMTWIQVADKAGIDQRLIFFWLNSTSEPRLVNVYRLAEAFGISVAELMEGVDAASSK